MKKKGPYYDLSLKNKMLTKNKPFQKKKIRCTI